MLEEGELLECGHAAPLARVPRVLGVGLDQPRRLRRVQKEHIAVARRLRLERRQLRCGRLRRE